jgi:hypothetical protein
MRCLTNENPQESFLFYELKLSEMIDQTRLPELNSKRPEMDQ